MMFPFQEVNHTTVAACHHLEEASLSKNDGNMCFANGQHKFALKCYNLVTNTCSQLSLGLVEFIRLIQRLVCRVWQACKR